MGISHERATQDNVRDILHLLPIDFARPRLLGPRQVVTVLMTMIREQCGYERGLALVHERWTIGQWTRTKSPLKIQTSPVRPQRVLPGHRR